MKGEKKNKKRVCNKYLFILSMTKYVTKKKLIFFFLIY